MSIQQSAPKSRNDAPLQRERAPLAVPIRSLGANHRERIAGHLLALEPQDRYLRFGYPANDAQIRRYVDGLDFEHDELFGIYNRDLTLIAMAHLAFSVSPECKSCAEFGVSVLGRARGRGFGSRLFERAILQARNEGVQLMFVHVLSENAAMINIARKAGATVVRDGPETEAYLRLPEADFDSHLHALLDQQLAEMDYSLKAQAKLFRDWLLAVQEIRQGVRDGRDQSSV